VKTDLLCKSHDPRLEVRPNPIKDHRIPVFPNFPSFYPTNLHKELMSCVTPSLLESLVDVHTQVPLQIQLKPTLPGEGAAEEKVINILSHLQVAKYTVHTRLQVITSPLKHASCVEPIHQNKPAKELNSRDAF
jgi:hypothetical protein